MADDHEKLPAGLSRREFLKISGLSAAVPLVAGPRMVQVGDANVAVHGPGKTPMTFNINGKKYTAELEPRVTFLDALRDDGGGFEGLIAKLGVGEAVVALREGLLEPR